jgi:hypothetical protein
MDQTGSVAAGTGFLTQHSRDQLAFLLQAQICIVVYVPHD